MQTALLWAAAGTGFTFLMTTLGAASVFLFRKRNSMLLQRVFLGFAAGVMIAASVWSLLIPAIERAEEAGQIGWIPAAGGFAIGVAFLWCCTSCCRTCIRARTSPKASPASGIARRFCSRP